MRFVKVFLVLLIISVFYVHGTDSGGVSISIIPGGVIPFGENASSFKTGSGVDLTLDFNSASLPFIFLRTAADYEYLPLATKDGLSLFSLYNLHLYPD